MKAIIVCDDLNLTSSIKQTIEWDRLSLELVEDFNDGTSFVTSYNINPVEIVLFDIDKPGIEGFSCINEIKRINPGVQIIILSSFTGFEYVKKALETGVNSYVSKPLNKEDLTTALNKAVDNILAGDKILLKYSARHKFFDSLPTLLEAKSLENINKEYHYSFKEGFFVIVHIIMTRIDLESGMFIKLVSSVDNELRNKLKHCIYEVESNQYHSNGVQVLINYHHDNDQIFKNMLTEALREVCSKIDIAFNCYSFAGVSSKTETITNITKLSAEARDALYDRFTHQEDRVMFIEDSESANSTVSPSFEEIKSFENVIDSGDSKVLCRWIDDYYLKKEALIERNPVNAIVCYFYFTEEFLTYVGRMMGSKVDKHSLQLLIINNYENCKTVNDLSEALKKGLSYIMDNYMLKNNDNTGIYTKQTKAYITEHHDRDVTLEIVADMLQITPTHLSSVFKKETGVGFNQYLTNIRIEHAKELLKVSKLHLNEIARAVGYNDANYFSTLFKKETGLAPREFRKLHQLQPEEEYY